MTVYEVTGRTYYCRFVRQDTGLIWDNVAEEMSAAPTWDDSVVEMVEVAGTGQYPIDVPTDLPRGVIYDVIVYLQDGSDLNNTDVIDSSYVLKLGSIFGF